MTVSRRIITALFAGAVTAPVPALAGGFYLQEQSPKETGRALSGGAAAADDPSTIYFNPAAMTQLPGVQTSVGGVILFAAAQQNDRGSTRTVPGVASTVPVTGKDGGNPFARVIPVPSFYASAQLGNRLWLGLGVNAPFGLKLDYDEDFFGRYDALNTDLKTYNAQPSFAYKLSDAVSVGGGVDVQYAKVILTNALPQLSPLLADGRTLVEGDDVSFGWNAGLFYTRGGTNIGIHYRSHIRHNLQGEQTNSGLQGALAVANGTVAATAPLSLPDIVTVSLTRKLTPHVRAMLTARWYNWSVFQSIAINSSRGLSVKVLDYHDSYSVSAGGEYDVSDRLTLRAGTMFDRTPTNQAHLTARVPDGDRVWLSTGATWAFSDRLALNLSYAHNFVAKSSMIRADRYYSGPAAVTVTTRSRTAGNADQLAAAFTMRF